MAYVTGSGTYNPFSFEELFAPIQIYRQAYKEQEAAYDALTQGAAGIESLQYSEPDSAEYKAYKAYMDDLNTAATELATKGLSQSSRQALRGLKNRYITDILPTQEAIKKREELDKEWRATHGKDATWIGNRPANLSIGEIKAGKYDTLYGVSGADVEKEAMTAAIAASNRRYEEMKPQLALYNQYIKTGMAQGYNPELASAILDDLEGSEFGKEITAIKNSSGYDKMSSAEQNRFNEYLFRGFFNGISYKETPDYKKNLDLDRALASKRLREDKGSTGKPIKTTTTQFSKVPQVFSSTLDSEAKTQLDTFTNIREGLVRTESGVSTASIESKKQRVQDLLSEITSIDTELGGWSPENAQKLKQSQFKNIPATKGAAALASSIDYSLGTPKEDSKKRNQYSEKQKLQKQYDTLQAELQNEIATMNHYVDKYSGLSDDLFTAISIGYDIERALSETATDVYNPIINPTDADKVATHLILSGLQADKAQSKDTKGFAVMDSAGKISNNDKEIIEYLRSQKTINPKEFTPVITSKGLGLFRVADGKYYFPKGVDELDIATDNADKITEWATGLTDKDLAKTVTLSTEDVSNLLSANMDEGTYIEYVNMFKRYGEDVTNSKGFYGMNIRATDGNVYKIIYNTADNSFRAISDIQDLMSGGERLGDYKQAIFEEVFNYYLNHVTK